MNYSKNLQKHLTNQPILLFTAQQNNHKVLELQFELVSKIYFEIMASQSQFIINYEF